MEVRNKRDFFALWEAGVLGNRTRLWRDPREAFLWGESVYHAQVMPKVYWNFPEIGFREIRKPGSVGAGKWEKVPWHRVFETAKRWQAEGLDFIMDDGCPDDKRTLQGEVVRTERGLEGFLDIGARLPMRPAMAAGHMKPYGYLATRLLLDRYMDPSSREDLDALLEQYPDAAIEFTCFSVNVGIFPNRNTLFWETRNY